MTLLIFVYKLWLFGSILLLPSFVMASTVKDSSSFRTIISLRIGAKSPIASNPAIYTNPSIFFHLLFPNCSLLFFLVMPTVSW